MTWTLPAVVPYIAVTVVFIVAWSLTCLTIAGLRAGWPATGLWLVGLTVIIGAPLVFVVVVRLLEVAKFGQ